MQISFGTIPKWNIQKKKKYTYLYVYSMIDSSFERVCKSKSQLNFVVSGSTIYKLQNMNYLVNTIFDHLKSWTVSPRTLGISTCIISFRNWNVIVFIGQFPKIHANLKQQPHRPIEIEITFSTSSFLPYTETIWSFLTVSFIQIVTFTLVKRFARCLVITFFLLTLWTDECDDEDSSCISFFFIFFLLKCVRS